MGSTTNRRPRPKPNTHLNPFAIRLSAPPRGNPAPGPPDAKPRAGLSTAATGPSPARQRLRPTPRPGPALDPVLRAGQHTQVRHRTRPLLITRRGHHVVLVSHDEDRRG